VPIYDRRVQIALLLEELVRATQRLEATVRELDDEEFSEASSLPGWTRAHVLTHIARNADGLRNLLLAARTGEAVRMYASPTTRAADIEAGASRPADVVRDDVIEAGRRFVLDAGEMRVKAWKAEVVFTSGQSDAPSIPADSILLMRLEELEIHHVDLGASYTFAHVPPDAAARLLTRYLHRCNRHGLRLSIHPNDIDWPTTGQENTEVLGGTAAALLAWLSGRSDGDGVRTTSDGPLPVLPPLN